MYGIMSKEGSNVHMKEGKDKRPPYVNEKQQQLDKFKRQNTGPGKKMTRDSGVKVSNDNESLRAGKRGPLLLQDFHFYQKQSRFNRERIPEKVVHARGFGVHGEFELTKSLRKYTVAKFLQEPGTRTPVFTRFSTFVGSKGSKDTAVDIRGFATKFYTQEGNYDMLALQFPVFILNDAMKFMDVTHSIKPDPITDIPQATGAHTRFWDYIANNQESAHMVMWLMSMRGRPRSWRMMEGWPINSYIFINQQGKKTFVRFAIKPKLGVHGLLLDEANIIGGVDPDFHRRDIVEAVKNGAYAQYNIGVQLIPEEDEFKYDFDVLDATKHWPEEVIPVEIIGKMSLNRLMDNFFAEEEQSVFDPANLVPGIDFSNDPVLQGRAFAYRDTEYHRLGANMNEIPINRPIVEVNTNHRDGQDKYPIDTDFVTYHENSLANNTPKPVAPEEGGFIYYPEKVEGHVTRELPSDLFDDHFSQARLFWNSLADFERKDLIESFTFHLQYVRSKSVQQQNVEMWANVDREFACILADNLGVERPKGTHVPEDRKSPAISAVNMPSYAYTQKVAVLVADGFDTREVLHTINFLEHYGAFVDIISEKLGDVVGNDGSKLKVDDTFLTKYSVLYDSFYIVGGRADKQSKFDKDIKEWYHFAYEHYKPIGVATSGEHYIKLSKDRNYEGVIFASNNPDFREEFVAAVATQRFWYRK